MLHIYISLTSGVMGFVKQRTHSFKTMVVYHRLIWLFQHSFNIYFTSFQLEKSPVFQVKNHEKTVTISPSSSVLGIFQLPDFQISAKSRLLGIICSLSTSTSASTKASERLRPWPLVKPLLPDLGAMTR